MVDCIQEQNNDDLTNTALAAVRYGLSNRGLAAVINGFLMDIDRVSSVKTKLLDVGRPEKDGRERCRVTQSKAGTRYQQQRGAELQALYFDGRHDQTSTAEAATRQLRNTLLWWRNQEMNVTHFTPVSSKTIDQVNELINVATGYGDSVHVLCCDGAAVNTVRSGGICRLSELIQDKNGPLVCLPVILE